MAKTIHTLAYMVTADTRSFTQGMVLTKNELKATKEVIEATRGPFQQFGMEVSSLSELHRKGAISGMQYTSSLNQLIAGHTAGIPIVGRFTSVLSLGNPLLVAGAVAAAGMAAGLAALTGAAIYATVKIRDQITKIDDLIASANKLGVGVSMLQAMGHAAALADIEIGTMTSGIESMAKAISKATVGKGGGSGQAKTAFQLLGLDPAELRAAKPEQQLHAITEALGRMTNQADKTRAALAIFGSADFLRLDASQIEHATKQLAAMGGGLSDLDVAVFGEFDDAVEDMNASLDVSWKRLTMAVIPSLTVAAEAATDWIVTMNRSREFQSTLETVGDVLVVIASITKELPGVTMSWLTSLEAANPKLMLLLRAGEMVGSAIGGPLSEISDANKMSRELDAKMAALEAARKGVQGPGQDEAERLREEAEAAKDLAEQMDRVAEAQRRAYQSGIDLVGGLAKEISTFGMTSREAAIYSAMLSGASITELSFADSLSKTLDKMDARKKLTDEMAAALKSARTPEEVFRDEVIKLREAMLSGIITVEEYLKLRTKAAAGLTRESDRPGGVNPMMEGSSAAAMFLAELRVRGTGEKDKTDIMVGVLKDIDKHIVEGKTTVPTTIPRLGAA